MEDRLKRALRKINTADPHQLWRFIALHPISDGLFVILDGCHVDGNEQLCYRLVTKYRDDDGIFITRQFVKEFLQLCNANEWISNIKAESIEDQDYSWHIPNHIYGYVTAYLGKSCLFLEPHTLQVSIHSCALLLFQLLFFPKHLQFFIFSFISLFSGK